MELGMAYLARTRSRYLSPLSELLAEGESWTVGFDKMLDELAGRWDAAFAGFNEYPHSHIKKTSANHYQIELDVGDFKKPELEIEVIGEDLIVTGAKSEASEEESFRQSFMLADYVKVTDAKLKDGVLEIDLVREVPAEKKPQAIEIH
ncbi:small heat shock protein IbpA [mine drainage metagenome]|uniref:Small heat shock protein IbpA n=1 Tax=mine drainage metagenome TaxID=410659 RepID=A0A1J5QD08_9ZZZZ